MNRLEFLKRMGGGSILAAALLAAGPALASPPPTASAAMATPSPEPEYTLDELERMAIDLAAEVIHAPEAAREALIKQHMEDLILHGPEISGCYVAILLRHHEHRLRVSAVRVKELRDWAATYHRLIRNPELSTAVGQPLTPLQLAARERFDRKIKGLRSTPYYKQRFGGT